MIKKLLIITTCLILTGCSNSLWSPADIRQVVISRCPPLVNYTPEQQRITAQELRSIYSDSQIAQMITDYAKLREACRVVTKRVNKRIKK